MAPWGVVSDCIENALKATEKQINEKEDYDPTYFTPSNVPLKLDFKTNIEDSLTFCLTVGLNFIVDYADQNTDSLRDWIYVYMSQRDFDMQCDFLNTNAKIIVFGKTDPDGVQSIPLNTELLVFIITSLSNVNQLELMMEHETTTSVHPIEDDRVVILKHKNTAREHVKKVWFTTVDGTRKELILSPENIEIPTDRLTVLNMCMVLFQTTIDYAKMFDYYEQFIPHWVPNRKNTILEYSIPDDGILDLTKRMLSNAIDEDFIFNYATLKQFKDSPISPSFRSNIAVWLVCLGDTRTERRRPIKLRTNADVILHKSMCLVPAFSWSNHVKEFVDDVKSYPNTYLNVNEIMFLYGKTSEKRDFSALSESQIQDCGLALAKTKQEVKFYDIVAFLDQMMSRDIEIRFECEVKWATRCELETWTMVVASLLFGYQFDFGQMKESTAVPFASTEKFQTLTSSAVRNSEFRYQQEWIVKFLELAPAHMIFVWSNKAYRDIQTKHRVKVVRVFTIGDWFDNMPFVEEYYGTTTPYGRFLINNKHCGFYAFDTKFYSSTMDFPVPMSTEQWIACRSTEIAMTDVERPTDEDRVGLHALISSILRGFVLKPFVEETPQTLAKRIGLKRRYTVFIEFCRGLKKASRDAKKNNFAYIDLQVRIDDGEKTQIGLIVEELFYKSAVKFVQRPMFEDFDVFIRRDLLFVFEEELRDVPEPMDTISGMNVRAQLCLELSKLDANHIFPDVLGVLFEDLYEGWNERLRSLKTIWMQERYFRMPRAVLVETERRDRGQLVHRVRWPDNKKACFNLCVTMHIPDRTRAVAVFDKWYKQTFTGEGPVYMKKLYGFMAAKAEEDESEGWRA